MNATLFGLLLILTTACKKSGLSSAELPTPEQVIERYEQALGGSDAELQNLNMVATIEVPLTGMSGTVDTWIIKDEGLMLQMDVGDIGTTYQGSDLNHVWAIDPMSGPKLLEGEERIAQLEQYNSMFTDMILQYQDSSLEQTGIKKINGQNAYRIEGVKRSTNKKHTMFFSVDSGLLIAEYGVVNMQGGSMKSKSFFTEYMDTEHGLMPKKIEQKMMGIQCFDL